MKLLELQYLRGVSIIAVVLIHVTVIYPQFYELDFFLLFLNQYARFCVPLFLFISGLLITYNTDKKHYKFNGLLKKRTVDLLLPYLIWTLIGLAFTIFILHRPIATLWIIKTIILGNGTFYQLYYIPLLFQFIILTPFILWCVNKLKNKYLMAVSLLLNVALFAYLEIGHLSNQEVAFIDLSVSFVYWFVYYLFGCMVGRYYTQFRDIIMSMNFIPILICYVLTLILVIIETSILNSKADNLNYATSFYRVSVVFYSISSIIIFYKISLVDRYFNKFFILVGNHSFGIYLSHVLILILITNINFLFVHPIFCLITLGLLIVICILINVVFKAIGKAFNNVDRIIVRKW